MIVALAIIGALMPKDETENQADSEASPTSAASSEATPAEEPGESEPAEPEPTEEAVPRE